MVLRMYEFIKYIIVVPVAIAVVLGGLFGLVVLAGKVTDMFTKKVIHPKYGPARYVMGVWSVTRSFGDYDKVAVYLPGSRTQIDHRADMFLTKIEAKWPNLQSEFLKHFAREIRDNRDDFVAQDSALPWPQILDTALQSDLSGLLKFSQLTSLSIEQSNDGKKQRAWINFHYAWDSEHSRTLLVGADCAVQDYGISVEM